MNLKKKDGSGQEIEREDNEQNQSAHVGNVLLLFSSSPQIWKIPRRSGRLQWILLIFF